MIQPVIQAVADEDSFALIEVARLEWEKFSSQSLEAVAVEFHRWANLEHVRLHLDHVPVIDEDNQHVDYVPIIRRAIECGYGSVMIDGSRLPLEKNIEATRQVVELAHRAGIPCEAELGLVLGHEDVPLPAYEELLNTGRGFTDPDEARTFVCQTGCDWLSVAIGNIHGPISKAQRHQEKVEARLNLRHLRKLAKATGIPLVLHGGSRVRPGDVRRAFTSGIAKINVATEIRQAYEASFRETGSIRKAGEAVYRRTRSLIRDIYRLNGSRRRL